MSGQNTELNTPALLEIGTEEIPSRFLPGAISDIRALAASFLGEYRIDFREVHSYATPRRLVLMITGLSPVQKDIVREIFGPSTAIAFDAQGNPSKAAFGFAKSLGIDVTDLTVRKKGKGEFIAAVIEEKGVETKKVLPEIIKKLVLALHFPKSMRWGDGRLSFVRPIHWIAAIFGGETVTTEIEGIRSNNMTRGHRFLSPASFQIKDIQAYTSILENNFVVLDQEKRKKIIRDGIADLTVRAGGQPVMDEDLLDTVTFLVEFPVPVLCSFDQDYLTLPKELLITVMKDHQKYFAVRDSDGNLLQHFIVISNTLAENSETVRIGAERVIRARFDDAKFYFHEDTKKPLALRIDELRQVTFHDELGSLFEKTEKVVSVASLLAAKIGLSSGDSLIRAAQLSKTDLLTGVVREFPELQGTMGKYYAKNDGEESVVAVALEEQYLPNSLGGKLPLSDIGALLSLSDKIDNVASFFSIGLIPTGSEDPFALRRQAMGIASILIDRAYPVTVREIFECALQSLPKIKEPEKVMANILAFMEQRVEFILSSMGYDQDAIKSVLALSSQKPLRTVIGRIEALRKFRGEATFAAFLLAIKRVYNIIPKTAVPQVVETLLAQEEEKKLHLSVTGIRDEILPFIQKENFDEAVRRLSALTVPVNQFFDKVLVMDKQEEIRVNRLALLKEVWMTASLIADFSKLL